ncbi:VapE domain-containing protein [Pseudahrensia aquimaris]|uniref:VapE domain-containing protein n=1 Tax=Pseudahrensia aquimaris TaxID=744461 RepID=A0ABW3FBK5_9HYPH
MENVIIRYSEGHDNLGKVKNVEKSWGDFKKMLSQPARTKESYVDYIRLSVAEKLKLKQASGFFCGAFCKNGSRRKENVGDRVILTLDLDENAKAVLDSYQNGTNQICQAESFIQTTRSHSPDHPKFRMVILLDRSIDKEEHQALSRIVAHKVDPSMRSIDPVSHRMAQMMFKPTATRDGEFIFHECRTGKALNVDKVFAAFKRKSGDWRDVSLLPKNPEHEDMLRDTMEKAEDPWAKDGPVGTFCRAWPIEDLIAEHLAEFYYAVDDDTGSEPRYTPVGSSGAAGVVVYEDGRFIYSNHTTDPIAGMNVNAWDLYRLCKFADLDDGVDNRTSVGNLPSSKAMLKFVQGEPRYRQQAIDEKYDFDEELDNAFSDEDVADAEFTNDESERKLSNSPTSATEPQQDQSIFNPRWFQEDIEFDAQSKIKNTLPNTWRILANDNRTRGKLALNEFTGQPVVRDTIDPKIDGVAKFHCLDKMNGTMLTDKFDAMLRCILSEAIKKPKYAMNPRQLDLKEAVMTVAEYKKFHPIRDLLNSLTWDGVERLKTVLHRYMGTPDDAYHREVFMIWLVALVVRQFEPGAKFDQMIVLEGVEGGERKSTFCEKLALDKYHVDVNCDLSDSAKVVEKIAGCMVGEFAEMKSHNKTDSETIKSMLSRNVEQVRLAYAKRPETYLRQTVFIGTTNKTAYLKDPSGARRYWPVRVMKTRDDPIDTEAFEEEYPQLLAEAVHLYREKRRAKPTGSLRLDLQSEEARAEQRLKVKIADQETPEKVLAGQIDEWMLTPTTKANILGGEENFADEDDETQCLRIRTCGKEIAVEVMEKSNMTLLDSYQISAAVELCKTLRQTGVQKRFPKGYGKQREYLFAIDTPTPKEMALGYREITDSNSAVPLGVPHNED